MRTSESQGILLSEIAEHLRKKKQKYFGKHKKLLRGLIKNNFRETQIMRGNNEKG